MNAKTFRAAACGTALFALGYATSLVAQSQTDSPNRHEQKRADLGGSSGMEVVESLVEYQPGEFAPAHLHHGIEAVYVIQGATIQVPGKDPALQPTGAVLMNARDAVHGGYKIVGDTPLKLFTVHIVDKGAPLYDYSK